MQLFGTWLLMAIVLACMGDKFAIECLLTLVVGGGMIFGCLWLVAKLGIVGLLIAGVICSWIAKWCEK